MEAMQADKSVTLYNVPPCHNIEFFAGGESVGKLDWSDGEMKFAGNAEESARIFFNEFLKQRAHFYIDDIIKREQLTQRLAQKEQNGNQPERTA
jgi:hypothetical protein